MIHVIRHVRIVIFAERFICAMPPGIRGIYTVAGTHQLADLHVKQTVIFAVAVHQDHRAPRPLHSVVERNPVHYYDVARAVF